MTKTNSPPFQWVKSSYSTDNGGACVEWAPARATTTGIVPVRDSKHTNGPVLTVSTEAFAGLVSLARSADL
ncbi:DUF397 domain-containing protein [Streptomyces uncialis]|uniref:DUF397 domain-containing protein n=1 Tax=Streptomyces uncialis TaxID=1048205 RepID=A0A1Q4V222_9ACTN|nr:DUF397 domain-containing protein [Streptomyces uncialis]OKH91789.1 hypothetical protein AB852_26305 [Streptomyces uncialis]WST70110.1 DUF397 domain-containing protein [Streptomyces uncialis]